MRTMKAPLAPKRRGKEVRAMGRMGILTKEEAEARIAELVEKIPDRLAKGVLPGVVFFAIPREYIVEDEDGSVTWSAEEVCIGMHSFIKLTTGRGKKKRTVYLPFCLVEPGSRRFAAAVARTTIDPAAGRYNSKPAELYIAEFEKLEESGVLRGFKIKVKLEGLVTHLCISSLLGLPLDRFRSKHCPYCSGEIREVRSLKEAFSSEPSGGGKREEAED